MSGDGAVVLCTTWNDNGYVMKRWDRNGYPVLRESSHDIDTLLQWAIVTFNDYSLVVFEFTKDQEANILVRKLFGH